MTSIRILYHHIHTIHKLVSGHCGDMVSSAYGASQHNPLSTKYPRGEVVRSATSAIVICYDCHQRLENKLSETNTNANDLFHATVIKGVM